MGEAFAEIAAGGPLLFAVGVAALAGLEIGRAHV